MDQGVFISYAKEDAALVLAVRDALVLRGIACWMDRENIGVGRNFLKEILAGINGADVVLVFITPSSVSSDSVRSELSASSMRGKRIVAVLVDGARPGDMLEPMLRFSDRVILRRGNVGRGVKRIERSVRFAMALAAIENKNSVIAICLSIIPGMGLLYLGLAKAGVLLLVFAIGLLFAQEPLELGTPLDRCLANFFQVNEIASILLTIHCCLLGKIGRRGNGHRWLPYCLSVFFPMSGISYSGRWRTAFFLLACYMIALLAVIGAGTAFVVNGCAFDALIFDALWLIGIAESGVVDDDGKHRNIILYTIVLALIIVICVAGLWAAFSAGIGRLL